ncbi:ATP-binding protein, partial [Streptococcus pneumoniae]|nr:ATP-binding protein [Streptococcus pneumoniae]
VETDAQRFSQIVGNLLSNAVKFTPSGEVEFDLTYEKEAILMTFRDTGIGIPEEHISQVFQPFHQVDSSSTRSFEGAGLGLAIVQRLVQALGGS